MSVKRHLLARLRDTLGHLMCAAGYHQVAARVLTGADGHLRWYRATCGRCGDTFRIEEEGF
jgi:hypothetical protein